MLVLALADLEMLLDAADLAAAMSVEALLGTDRVFAADLQALRPHPGQARSAARMAAALAGLADRRLARRTRTTRACRTPTRCAARPAVHGAARDTDGPRAARRGPGTGQRHRQSGGPARRPGGVQRQLPRRAGRRGARLPGHLASPTSPASASDAPTGCSTRPVARPAAVPRARGRRRLGTHDRPVHAGRDRLRAQASGRAGVGRLHPVVGDAGGPRLARLARRPQAAPGGGRSAPGPGHRDPHRRTGSGPPRAVDARARDRCRAARRPDQGRRAGPGPPPRHPRSTPSSTFSPPARSPPPARLPPPIDLQKRCPRRTR